MERVAKWFSARAEAHRRVDEKRERAYNGWMTLSRKRKMEARDGSTKGRDRVRNARATSSRNVCNRVFLCNHPSPPCKMSASSLLSENEHRQRDGSDAPVFQFSFSRRNNDIAETEIGESLVRITRIIHLSRISSSLCIKCQSLSKAYINLMLVWIKVTFYDAHPDSADFDN